MRGKTGRGPTGTPSPGGGHISIKRSEPIQNRLLATLPPGELARLSSNFEQIDLPLRKILPPARGSVGHAYFPQRGIVSLVRPMSDGSMVEVGIVGREGFVGLDVVLGGDMGGIQEMVQIAGSALAIPTAALLKEVDRCPIFAARLLRYGEAMLIQISQTAACNARHTIQERLARWLLMVRDRIDDDDIAISHELLSMMLGARRAGITVALGILKTAGLIANRRGKIRILDDEGLEAAACECYRIVREEVERLQT